MPILDHAHHWKGIKKHFGIDVLLKHKKMGLQRHLPVESICVGIINTDSGPKHCSAGRAKDGTVIDLEVLRDGEEMGEWDVHVSRKIRSGGEHKE